MTSPLSLNLKSVDTFTIVQMDGESSQAKREEKAFTNLKDALSLMAESQAAVKYLEFYHEGFSYKLYPSTEKGEYRVVKSPTLN